MARFIHQVHIADGFSDDCEELVHRCSQHEILTYQHFTEIWKDMNMASIYQGRTIGAEIPELSEEVLHIAKRYMVANTSNFEASVAGLFLVYGLMHTQPFKGFAALRLVPDDVPAISRIEVVARRDRRLDVLYILGSILAAGPVQCHAENREYGFDQSLRKYLEGYTGIDKLGIRPKGVFYRQNEELDIIRELSSITRLYENSKASINDEMGRRDPNLTYADKELPAQLECSLKRIINGLIDDDKECSPANERIDRIRAIKARAMKNAIAPIKHLTAIDDKKPSKITVTNNRKKADSSRANNLSKSGKVKTGSPRKPVTTGSPRKPKKVKKPTRNKKAIPPNKNSRRRKKRQVSSSDSSDSTIILSDFVEDDDDMDIDDDDVDIDTWIAKHKDGADLNVDKFQRVEIGDMKRLQPNIDELVEKEYDVHIDTMPIFIKSTATQDFEIEFIDNFKKGGVDKSKSKKGKQTRNKTKKSADVIADIESSNEVDEMNSVVHVDGDSLKQPAHYNLRRPEKRELKKPAIKSKFKKMGLENLVINKNGNDTSPGGPK